MKIYSLILLLFFSFNLTAQKIKLSDVLKTSDSILLTNTNINLIQFFTETEGSYYSYKKGKSDKIGKFSTRQLKNNVKEIWVHYSFKYPKIEGISNGIWVKLNQNLELIEPLNLEFIPEFLWKNETSNFISKENAKDIAIPNFEKKGIKIENAELMYNDKTKSYVYMIVNKLNETPNIANKPSGNTEVIKVDALTGKIVEKFDGYYGLIIR